MEMNLHLPAKLFRLRQGNRYVVAIQEQDGQIRPTPFWSETQALASAGVPSKKWASIPIEVYAAIHEHSGPDNVAIFKRSTRRGAVQGVLLWSADGIHNAVFASVEEAVASAVSLCA